MGSGFNAETIGLAINAGSLVVTTILAVLVYRFSRFSATSASVQSINEGWAVYNSTMLADDNVKVINEFLAEDARFDGTERAVHFILYLLLNNLSSQYYAAQSGLLKAEFSTNSAEDYFRWLKPRSEYILELMEQRGYDSELIQFARNGFNAAITEKLAEV